MPEPSSTTTSRHHVYVSIRLSTNTTCTAELPEASPTPTSRQHDVHVSITLFRFVPILVSQTRFYRMRTNSSYVHGISPVLLIMQFAKPMPAASSVKQVVIMCIPQTVQGHADIRYNQEQAIVSIETVLTPLAWHCQAFHRRWP